ncbi:glycosyltransferase family 39 protein [Baaleninema sp.]|uniref:glycosyltransferase family 39 protein n=1 Tax=Baaleninema sp. TaxID=3101197 RepID=UPI003D026887
MLKFKANPFIGLTLVVLAFGILFRLSNLDSKVYWVDEVATSIRIVGYTKTEVIEELSGGEILTPPDLQTYQKLQPQKTFRDTLNALVQSPEHAPLYFILARFWVQIWGDSVLSLRSLSILFAFLSFPVLYITYWELFSISSSRHLITSLSPLLLFSLSPIFVAYAQEARPYSLWIFLLLLLHLTCLRAIGRPSWERWGLYTIVAVLNLYTSLLSIPVVAAQGIYGIWRGKEVRKPLFRSLGIAAIAFLPWVVVMFDRWRLLQDNTTWTRENMDGFARVAIWIYNLSILFIDLVVPQTLTVYKTIEGLTIAIATIAVLGVSLRFLKQQAQKSVSVYLGLTIAALPVVTISCDFMTGGQISTAARYWIPSYLGLQLILAYFFSLEMRKRPGVRGMFAVVLSAGLVSGWLYLDRAPKYQKTRNLHNPAIAEIVNRSTSPLVLIEPRSILDMISLSYDLESHVKILVSDAPPSGISSEILLFNPSPEQLDRFQPLKPIPLYQPPLLWDGEIHLSLWKLRCETCDRPVSPPLSSLSTHH